jgi:hypothetical protein
MRRNPGALDRGADETVAWYFALFIDGRQGSKVESTKELLALVQETSGLGETHWVDRDIGVQVSSYGFVLPSGGDRLIHGSFLPFQRQFQRSQALVASGAHLRPAQILYLCLQLGD